jgi:hypothetical protein
LYFDIAGAIRDPAARVHFLFLYLAAFSLGTALVIYFVSYFRYVYLVPVAHRITSDRWYTIAPVTVSLIVVLSFLAFPLSFMALMPQYGCSISFFICVLAAISTENAIAALGI